MGGKQRGALASKSTPCCPGMDIVGFYVTGVIFRNNKMVYPDKSLMAVFNIRRDHPPCVWEPSQSDSVDYIISDEARSGVCSES